MGVNGYLILEEFIFTDLAAKDLAAVLRFHLQQLELLAGEVVTNGTGLSGLDLGKDE